MWKWCGEAVQKANYGLWLYEDIVDKWVKKPCPFLLKPVRLYCYPHLDSHILAREREEKKGVENRKSQNGRN